MNNVSNRLLVDAVSKGLCKEHTEAWDTEMGIPALVAYYKANPNWCLERHYPSLAFMDAHFNTKDVRKMGVYINRNEALRATDLIYVFNNCTVGIITSAVTRFYFGLDSKAKIIVEDGGILTIDSYDNTELDIELRGKARCIVYQYGDVSPRITGSKNYKIRKK